MNFPSPTPQEQTLWDSGDRTGAVLMYRQRTSRPLGEAYCALKGITPEEHERNATIDPKYRKA
jgi:hypothetical protein